MSSGRGVLLQIVILTVAASSVSALECYFCAADDICKNFDETKVAKSSTLDGGAQALAENMFGDLLGGLTERRRRAAGDCTMCVKQESSNGDVARSCSTDTAMDEQCVEESGNTYCLCTSDLCNGAPGARRYNIYFFTFMCAAVSYYVFGFK